MKTAALALVLLGALAAQQAPPAANWDAWRFLIGEWVAEGGGQPGQGSGGFSFQLQLDGRILVRKNYAEYPATAERPAFRHDDLLVVYPESRTKRTRAIYFDNEGHVIHYSAEFSSDGNSVVFLSDAVASEPRFRLSYTKRAGGSVAIKFEIAPPGKPEAFATYLESVARRR